ncbi:hypothetical protein LUX29_21490 [Aureimonas altamirensis]|uniref:hypothetical protein n=1 Tax=Aureimonas altamirensis TaxID=370622 RepID=UPI001E4132D2|nr:hypothetical protein [Aureimonas altamirensis]UHD45529.1 hypothetical protein LUX29_21490 [Aureimonas altamirensis]
MSHSQVSDKRPTAPVELFLRGARVTSGFRSALFDAANRAGVTPNEFVITAAAEKLARSGASFPGIFRRGDLNDGQAA